MSDPNTTLTLQAVVSAFESRGGIAPAELRDHPALVHCTGVDKAEAWGFETRAVVAPWDARVALAVVRSGSRASPELLAKAGAVYTVMKRPGGPFPDRIGVGRTRTADISLRLGSVSKYHAYFTYDEAQRRWHIWDARSRNGTRVADRRLEPGEGSPLENGIQLTFGDEPFLFFTERGFRELVETLAQNGAPATSR